MKKKSITITVYEKGDRVLTPAGSATVLKDEDTKDIEKYMGNRDVLVKLDEPDEKDGEDEKEIDAWYFHPILEE